VTRSLLGSVAVGGATSVQRSTLPSIIIEVLSVACIFELYLYWSVANALLVCRTSASWQLGAMELPGLVEGLIEMHHST